MKKTHANVGALALLFTLSIGYVSTSGVAKATDIPSNVVYLEDADKLQSGGLTTRFIFSKEKDEPGTRIDLTAVINRYTF